MCRELSDLPKVPRLAGVKLTLEPGGLLPGSALFTPLPHSPLAALPV